MATRYPTEDAHPATPFKECLNCFSVNPSAKRVCRNCGLEFYPSKSKKVSK